MTHCFSNACWHRSLFILALFIVFLSGCFDRQSQDLIGLTGGDGERIGGAGLTEEGQGIGGTGSFGVVTGIGSIFVNRFKIAMNDQAVVKIDGTSGSR